MKSRDMQKIIIHNGKYIRKLANILYKKGWHGLSEYLSYEKDQSRYDEYKDPEFREGNNKDSFEL